MWVWTPGGNWYDWLVIDSLEGPIFKDNRRDKALEMVKAFARDLVEYGFSTIAIGRSIGVEYPQHWKDQRLPSDQMMPHPGGYSDARETQYVIYTVDEYLLEDLMTGEATS